MTQVETRTAPRRRVRIPSAIAGLVMLALPIALVSRAHGASTLSINVSTANAVVTASGTGSTVATITVNTSWNMPGYRNVNVTTCTYMAAGLASVGGPTVPIANIRVTQGASTRTMSTQTNCANASALVIGTSFITDNNSADPITRSRNGFRVDAMGLQVVNTGSLPPGDYTGTVFVTALVY